MTERKFGYVRDNFNPEDFDYRPKFRLFNLPKEVDLRAGIDTIYDQGQTSSCVAHGIVAAFKYQRAKQGKSDLMPSRLFLYYNARKKRGWEGEDSGCMIRDGIKVSNKFGICKEEHWAFNTENILIKPNDPCYE